MSSTTLTSHIISSLKGLSEDCNIRTKKEYVTGYARFQTAHFDTVLKSIKDLIKPVVANGEKIESTLSHGDIIDTGIKQFEIKKGVLIEVYDFEKITAIFIRLYHITDKKKEWLALYIDENPNTAWWGEERKEIYTDI